MLFNVTEAAVSLDANAKLHKDRSFHPIQNHVYVNQLRRTDHFDKIKDLQYFDIYGDGNCLYYSLYLSILPLLQDINNQLYRTFFNIDAYSFAEEAGYLQKSDVKIHTELFKYYVNNIDFKDLTRAELFEIARYIKNRILAELCTYKYLIDEIDTKTMKRDFQNDEEFLALLSDDEMGLCSFAIHFAKMLGLEACILFVTTEQIVAKAHAYSPYKIYGVTGLNTFNDKVTRYWVPRLEKEQTMYLIFNGGHFQATNSIKVIRQRI